MPPHRPLLLREDDEKRRLALDKHVIFTGRIKCSPNYVQSWAMAGKPMAGSADLTAALREVDEGVVATGSL